MSLLKLKGFRDLLVQSGLPDGQAHDLLVSSQKGQCQSQACQCSVLAVTPHALLTPKPPKI